MTDCFSTYTEQLANVDFDFVFEIIYLYGHHRWFKIMELVIVGKNEDCKIEDVVLQILGTSPKLSSCSIHEIMNKLGTNTALQHQVIKCLQEENANTYDLMEEILKEWANRPSTVASLDKLVYVLKKCNLADSAETLRQRFCIKTIKNSEDSVRVNKENKHKSLDCGLIRIVYLEAKKPGKELQAKPPHHTVEFMDGWMCPTHQGINLALKQALYLLQIVSVFVSIILLVIFFLPIKHFK